MKKNNVQKWVSRGLILKPSKDIWWMYSHVGASCAEVIDKNKIKLYISGRASDNKSRIGCAYIEIGKKIRVIKIDKNPILDLPKKPGFFDTDGILYPYIINFKRKTFLYYCGWMNHKTFTYNCNIGVAIKKNNQYKKYSNYPIIPLDEIDPIGTGSMAIYKVNKNLLRMYYVSFLPWEDNNGSYEPRYYIKIAESVDGIKWKKLNKTALGLQKNEIAVAKPSVYLDNKNINLFFCARGQYYKIYQATSKNGINFLRNKNALLLPSGNWDSQSQTYPYVFKVNNRLIMLYNGNKYGKTGLGFAELI